jgi:hypothetical protein
MFEWFLNLFRYEQHDFVLLFLDSMNIFYRVVNTKDDKYGKTYCGFERIAFLCALIDKEQNGLRMYLRVYRSSNEPYRYIFIWSFGDNTVKDHLFNNYHTTNTPFRDTELDNVLEELINSLEATKFIYSTKMKFKSSNASSIKGNQNV